MQIVKIEVFFSRCTSVNETRNLLRPSPPSMVSRVCSGIREARLEESGPVGLEIILCAAALGMQVAAVGLKIDRSASVNGHYFSKVTLAGPGASWIEHDCDSESVV